MTASCIISYYDKETKKLRGTLCFNDGYITHTGTLLQKFYNDNEKASKLCEFEEIKTLDVFDRLKATDKNPLGFSSVESFLKSGYESGFDYLYVWDSTAWFVSNLNAEDKRFEALENFFF